MKDVCKACRYSKDKGGGVYCVKYGIIIYQPRIYCISWERDTKDDKVQKQENRA